MRQSASRTRSLFIRYALAEVAAFPGIRTEWSSFPYNQKPAREVKHSRTASVSERLKQDRYNVERDPAPFVL